MFMNTPWRTIAWAPPPYLVIYSGTRLSPSGKQHSFFSGDSACEKNKLKTQPSDRYPPLDGASVTFPLYQNSHVYNTAAVHSSAPAGGDRDIRSQELENASILKKIMIPPTPHLYAPSSILEWKYRYFWYSSRVRWFISLIETHWEATQLLRPRRNDTLLTRAAFSSAWGSVIKIIQSDCIKTEAVK